jgi:uncharacterized membrane protein
MNDWEIKRFLNTVLVVQFTLWGLIYIETIGFKVPILRQVVGFIYLIFIPGFLILRVLRLHRLGNVEVLLYATGLSVASLMFIGLFMNTLHLLIGIPTPISLEPLIITISIFVSVLCILSYLRDRNFTEPSCINFKEALFSSALHTHIPLSEERKIAIKSNILGLFKVFSTKVVLLMLIPFLSIFGAHLVNLYNQNLLLIILLLILSVIPFFVTYGLIPKKLYPLALWVIAISLLFHVSLISPYIQGSDTHYEYFFSRKTLENGFWLPSSTEASILSVTVLPVLLVELLKINLEIFFKILSPFIYSLSIFGIYSLFKEKWNEETSFFASFYIISSFIYYNTILFCPRQMIGEFFFIILLMLNFTRSKITGLKKALLLIIFSLSIIVSHYTISYLSLLLCILSKISSTLAKKMQLINHVENNNNERDHLTKSSYILTFLIATLGWYIYNSNSHFFIAIVNLGHHIISCFYTEFLNPEASRALASPATHPLNQILKIMYYISQLCIIIGVIDEVVKRKFDRFTMFSFAMLSLLAGTIILPYYGLNTDRIFHFSLLLLAPYCIQGFIRILASFSISKKLSLKVFSLYIAIFLLLNSGCLHELLGVNSGSIPLSLNKKIPRSDINTFEYDVASATWLNKHADITADEIYADIIETHPLISYGMLGWGPKMVGENMDIKRGEYVYFGYRNLIEGILYVEVSRNPYQLRINYNASKVIPSITSNLSKIYNNGGGEIWVNL